MATAERQFIRDLIAGDRAAANEFVRFWYPQIKSWIAGRASPSKVEDYAQEVWQHLIKDEWRVLLKWKALDDDAAWNPRSLSAFLKRVTVNKVVDLKRAEGRQLPPAMDPVDIIDVDGPLGADPLVQADRARLEAAFVSCFSRFNDQDQNLLRMWWEGYTGAETGAELAMTPNNVYQRHLYLMRQLRLWAKKLDVDINWLGVREMKSKWASCSTNGNLNFNSELLGLDEELQDYVIVHELLHFSVPNHGKLWKSLMSAHLGDYQDFEERLAGLVDDA